MTNDYRKIIPTLVQGKIKFIVIGGVAAIVDGSARTTFDNDELGPIPIDQKSRVDNHLRFRYVDDHWVCLVDVPIYPKEVTVYLKPTALIYSSHNRCEYLHRD